MIKRLIFDIDNTLIMWDDKYYDAIIFDIFNKFNIEHTEENYKNIIKSMNEYEKEYYKFDKIKMLDYINLNAKKDYPIEFIEKALNGLSNFAVPKEIDDDIVDTLEYLKDKYEIVALTDWFGDVQRARLEKCGILKYFSKIFSAEETNRKPFKEAFITAIEYNKPEECVMIGDNIDRDIKGALNAGLNAIYFNPNNIKQKIKDENKIMAKISKIGELKEIL